MKMNIKKLKLEMIFKLQIQIKILKLLNKNK